MERTKISSAAPWEESVGYSRAVRVGPHVWVSGTAGTDEKGALVGADDAGVQARRALLNIKTALERVGASLGDVVRTRLYITDLANWDAIAAAHKEAFDAVRPVSIMAVVAGFVHPDILLEIEVDAFVIPPSA